MSTSTQDIVKLVKDELLPVYLKHHREHIIETPVKVLELIKEMNTRERQIPALLKPPKNSY